MIKIRKTIPEDRQQLIKIFIEFINYLNNSVRTDEVKNMEELRDFSKNIDQFVEEIFTDNNKITLVAVDNESIVGFISGEIKKKKHKKMDKYGYINDLYVSSEHQNKKIGSSLMYRVQDEFKKNNCKYLSLNCNYNNVQALAIYKQWGFFPCYIDLRYIL
jgi:ribosomal protein S18 acetylase RimI-like enzyme